MDRNEELRILLEENHDGHRGRLRKRVQLAGLDSLKPHEALEFLLSYIIPRQDVNDLAHALMDAFGTVDDVLHAETGELMRVKGMGRKAAEWLGWLGETVDAFTGLQRSDSVILNTGMKTMIYGMKLRRAVEAPSTWQLCLNRDYHLIYRREICPARAWGEPLTLREALGDVLRMKAKHVILMQFVGREDARPEAYDIDHARRYGVTLRSAGCDLVDILLMNEQDCVSMWQEGKILQPERGSAFERRRRNVSEDLAPYLYDMDAASGAAPEQER